MRTLTNNMAILPAKVHEKTDENTYKIICRTWIFFFKTDFASKNADSIVKAFQLNWFNQQQWWFLPINKRDWTIQPKKKMVLSGIAPEFAILPQTTIRLSTKRRGISPMMIRNLMYFGQYQTWSQSTGFYWIFGLRHIHVRWKWKAHQPKPEILTNKHLHTRRIHHLEEYIPTSGQIRIFH